MKNKKLSSRDCAIKIFNANNIRYDITGNGNHFTLLLEKKIHFWPLTNRWRVGIGGWKTRRGLMALMNYIKDNEL